MEGILRVVSIQRDSSNETNLISYGKTMYIARGVIRTP
jgi:hypothetical protein